MITNETQFWLGESTGRYIKSAGKIIPKIRTRMVFVNKIVVTDARLLFGVIWNRR
ncbi:hypothetical protein ACNF40_03015 [Cuniculiplasma sp. SKW4]|uniref:hypothetical protein n=1 Tax=Cuniculiplasma sp. SKW4 TaxID=3400171 RepID=UPI003FD156FE